MLCAKYFLYEIRQKDILCMYMCLPLERISRRAVQAPVASDAGPPTVAQERGTPARARTGRGTGSTQRTHFVVVAAVMKTIVRWQHNDLLAASYSDHYFLLLQITCYHCIVLENTPALQVCSEDSMLMWYQHIVINYITGVFIIMIVISNHYL